MVINDQIIELIKAKGNLTPAQIINETGKPRSSVFKALTELFKEGRLVKYGQHPQITYAINKDKLPFSKPEADDKTIPGLEVGEPVQSKTDAVNSSKLKSKSPYLFILLVCSFCILIAFLAYYVLKYYHAERQLLVLHLEADRQDLVLKEIDMRVVGLQEQLSIKNEQLADIVQKKTEQDELLFKQKEELVLQQGQVDLLRKDIDKLIAQFAKDRAELLDTLKSQNLLNGKLKEEIAALNKRVGDLNSLNQDAVNQLILLKAESQKDLLLK